jgi:hypothetical protein
MAEEDNGAAPAAAETPAAPSLEDTMGAVFDKMNSEPAASSPAAPEPSAEAVSPAEQPASPDVRPRGPDGKFVKADKQEPAPEQAAAPQNPEATPSEPATAPTAPKSWNAKGRDLYVKADPALREYIAQREGEMEKGVLQLRQRYDALEQVIGPRRDVLAASYGSPEAAIQQLFALSDFATRDAPGFIKYFAQQRGIDLSALTGQPGGQQSLPPELAALHTEVSTIKQTLEQKEQAERLAAQQAITNQIESFRLATNADGTSKHPHFEDVRADMAALMQAGRAETLDQAYEMATYANPTVRAQILASQQAKADEQRRREAEARAAEARRVAGTNLSARGAVAGSPSKPSTMEETMAAVFDRMSAA